MTLAPLAACEMLSTQPAVPDNGGSVEEVAEFGASLRTLDDEALEALYRELDDAAQPQPSAWAVRLAMLLSYGDSDHYDVDRAINLLTQVARTRRNEDPALRTFAEFLAAMLIERRTIAANRDALAEAQAQNAERMERNAERLEQLRAELEQTRAELVAERERSEKLESQLQALIELEEQLTLDDANEGETANER